MSESNDVFAKPEPRQPSSASASSSSETQPQAPPLRYEKPHWGAVASYDYGFEVLKGGVSIEKITGPKKDCITLGRLPICDVQMEHPSVSRYHAVIQFNQSGDAFIYDLESAHGTRLNKKRIPPHVHLPLRVGDQLRFGESTRIYVFESDKPEAQGKEMEEALRHRSAAADAEHAAEDDEEEGINWGFQEDAPEEPDEDETGEARNDASLIDVNLEKKMAEDAKRRREELDIMYGESDDETLYDKTKSRKKQKVKKESKAETYEELVAKRDKAEAQIKALEKEIEEKRKQDAAAKAAENQEDEDLDAYMSRISKKQDTGPSIHQLTKDLVQLKKDYERLQKLVRLTKPADIFT